MQDHIGVGQRVEPVPPPEPIVVEEPKVAPAGSYYTLFMGDNPLRFNGREGKDKIGSWLIEIDKAFDVVELLEQLKVKFGIYILVEYTMS